MPVTARTATKMGGVKLPLTAANSAPLKRKITSKKAKKPVDSDDDDGEETEKAAREDSKAKKLKGKEKVNLKEDEPRKKTAMKKSEVKKAGPKAAEVKKAAKSKVASKSKSKKALTPPPESSDTEEDEEQASNKGGEGKGEDGSESEEVILHGFSSESDSSDEDDVVDDAPVDVGKLPTIAKDDATVKRKLEKAKRQAVDDRGVLYLGRIPHGFYEVQMKAYFSQFGDVTRVRLSRNKKTGRSKHYAFIEMSSSAVAKIVAETMDNYLLMGHILRCKVIPKEEVHPELWVGANRKFRRVPVDRIARQQQNKARTDEEKRKVEKRLLKRQEQKKRKLQAAGIDYDIGPVGYVKKAKQSV